MNGTASETRALKQNLSVGDLVLFGSPHGEKTAARILKLNPKRAKVIQLEDRGGRGGVGTVWNVSYNAVMTLPSGHRLSPQLIDPKERQTPAATSGEKPALPWPAGRKIVSVRPITQSELDAEHWCERSPMQPVVLVVTLDDGGLLYGSSDEEGNKPGVIFGRLNGQALALDITHTMPPVGWRTV